MREQMAWTAGWCLVDLFRQVISSTNDYHILLFPQPSSVMANILSTQFTTTNPSATVWTTFIKVPSRAELAIYPHPIAYQSNNSKNNCLIASFDEKNQYLRAVGADHVPPPWELDN
jgi:hypothetical protein